MASFQFTQGTESHHARPSDSSPLLGRFRAVPPRHNHHHNNNNNNRRQYGRLGRLGDRLVSEDGGRGSVHVGYGALVVAELEAAQREEEMEGHYGDDDEDDDEDERRGQCGLPRWRRLWRVWVLDLWVAPRHSAVRKVVETRWSRYELLVLLPALLAVAWCAIPLPQHPLESPESSNPGKGLHGTPKTPGHGQARVRVNFWFFLFVYYGFYNLTALTWITKLFNLYSLNWWPQSLGFPLTVSLIAIASLAVPIPLYLRPETRFLTLHNTTWITWTFFTMAMPVAVAFCILLTNERHMGPLHSLSETQRIFTSSWWAGEYDDGRDRKRGRRGGGGGGGGGGAGGVGEIDYGNDISSSSSSSPAAQMHTTTAPLRSARPGGASRQRQRQRLWLPASFVRFLWFCVALFIGLMAYVIGEAYAEMYLRTLPHNSLETVVYVYGWVATVHLLDALTGWVLGLREGERVGSYPLSWVFKLYFMLTYQMYVRALYARLRSPQQFVILQLLSSTSLVVMTPLTMTRTVHRALVLVGLNGQSYGSYQKLQARNVLIRFLAENATMAAFLGSVAVLHFGANKDAYPYFAFDDADGPYDFRLTFWASSVTWACELVASLAVRGFVRLCFGVDVGLEGKLDLAVWPELLPTCVTVTLHVLQNMLFSIIRLQFYT